MLSSEAESPTVMEIEVVGLFQLVMIFHIGDDLVMTAESHLLL